ncbi:putative transposase orfB for insertion sequence element [Oscillibacter valericigenes Sjm18-20]|nr:putative transposase orfB for insertion sequence element [Oscillibacter valericigenes Sjm18-20]
MCRVVKVSESGYYRSLQSAGKPKPWQLLPVKIREIYNENPDNDNYGVGRILLALTLSAPVIKCKKTPVKKCRFAAERNAIWYTRICLP